MTKKEIGDKTRKKESLGGSPRALIYFYLRNPNGYMQSFSDETYAVPSKRFSGEAKAASFNGGRYLTAAAAR